MLWDVTPRAYMLLAVRGALHISYLLLLRGMVNAPLPWRHGVRCLAWLF